MPATLEQARRIAMELTRDDRLQLAEELAATSYDARWLASWRAEVNRRAVDLESGEDPGLTPDEFWSDDIA